MNRSLAHKKIFIGALLSSIGFVNLYGCKTRTKPVAATQKNVTAVKSGTVYALAPLGAGIVMRKCAGLVAVTKVEDFSLKCPEVISPEGNSNQRIFTTDGEFRTAWNAAFELTSIKEIAEKDEGIKPIAGRKNSDLSQNAELLDILSRKVANLAEFVKLDPEDEVSKAEIAELQTNIEARNVTQKVIDAYEARVGAFFVKIKNNKEVLLAKFSVAADTAIVSIVESIYNSAPSPGGRAALLSDKMGCVVPSSNSNFPSFDIMAAVDGSLILDSQKIGWRDKNVTGLKWTEELCKASLANSRNNAICFIDVANSIFYYTATSTVGGKTVVTPALAYSMKPDAPYECLLWTAFSTPKAMCVRELTGEKYLHVRLNRSKADSLLGDLTGLRYETFDECMTKISEIK